MRHLTSTRRQASERSSLLYSQCQYHRADLHAYNICHLSALSFNKYMLSTTACDRLVNPSGSLPLPVGDRWVLQLVVDVFIRLDFCCRGYVEETGD